MAFIEIQEILTLDIKISVEEEIKDSTKYWIAKCKQFNIEAKGETSTEARENLIELIKKSDFILCD